MFTRREFLALVIAIWNALAFPRWLRHIRSAVQPCVYPLTYPHTFTAKPYRTMLPLIGG